MARTLSIVHGKVLLPKLLDALGTKPERAVRSLTLHCDIHEAVSVTTEFFPTEAETQAITAALEQVQRTGRIVVADIRAEGACVPIANMRADATAVDSRAGLFGDPERFAAPGPARHVRDATQEILNCIQTNEAPGMPVADRATPLSGVWPPAESPPRSQGEREAAQPVPAKIDRDDGYVSPFTGERR